MSAQPAGVARTLTPARILAVGLLLATVVGGVAIVAAMVSIPEFGDVDDPVLYRANNVVIILDAFVFSAAGALIVWRQPGNTVGWILCATGLIVITFIGGFSLGAARTLEAGPDDLLAGLLSVLGAASFYPTFVVVSIIALVFPDGRLPSRRWRVPVAIVLTPIVIAELMFLFGKGRLDPSLANNPFGVLDAPADVAETVTAVVNATSLVALLASYALAVAAVAVRFRGSRGFVRQQHKWFFAAMAVLAVVLVRALIQSDDPQSIFDVVASASFALVPIAILIAVLRYRLYEIDRLVSRTIGWAIVTGILVATFALGTIALQAVLTSVTNTQGETLAVAASTLITLALFGPVRGRVQRAVDRRFDRARYDGERVVEAFAGRLRDQFDLDVLADEVGRVAAETVRPTMAVVWLRPTTRAHP